MINENYIFNGQKRSLEYFLLNLHVALWNFKLQEFKRN